MCSHQNCFSNAAEATNNRDESRRNGEQAVSFHCYRKHFFSSSLVYQYMDISSRNCARKFPLATSWAYTLPPERQLVL